MSLQMVCRGWMWLLVLVLVLMLMLMLVLVVLSKPASRPRLSKNGSSCVCVYAGEVERACWI
jgi:hypothetical protein